MLRIVWRGHEYRKTAFLLATPFNCKPLVFSAHAHNLEGYVGKGRQHAHVDYSSTTALISVQIDALQDADAALRVCAVESSS
jgi:hypothetical protein